MIIDKELIIEAKEKFQDQAIAMIIKDLSIEDFDERNLKCNCPFHSEKSSSFIWNKKDGGYFKCFGACGKVYGIIDHFIEYYKMSYPNAVKKLFELTNTKCALGEIEVRSKRDYRYPNEPDILDRTKVEEYMATRKISKETLDFCDIMSDAKQNIIFKYYNDMNVLCMLKYRPSRIIKKGENKMWFDSRYDNSNLLFNMNRANPSQPLVITEGCIDTLAVIESGYKNSVSIPKGSQSMGWIDECWDFLEQFESIIIWFDEDEAGRKAREQAIQRLGTWRCKLVESPMEFIDKKGEKRKVKDINEVLFYFGKEKVLDCILNSKEAPLEDFIEIDDVHPFDLDGTQGIYTGLKGIDDIVYKLCFGNVVLWTGRRGNGKSVLANQIALCEPVNQGYPVAAFSLELPNAMLRAWVDRNMAGREHVIMKNEKIPTIAPNTMQQIKAWREGMVFLYNNEINYANKYLLKKIEDVVRRKGVKSVLIDNFMMVDLEANHSDKYDKQTEFIKQLILLAKKLHCLIHLVCHPRKSGEGELQNDDISGSGDITNLAQYVFAIKRYTDKDRAGLQETKYSKATDPHNFDLAATVLKNRITGDQDKSVNLYFDYPSYRIYDSSVSLWKRYKWNKDTSKLPTDNPKLVFPDFMNK